MAVKKSAKSDSTAKVGEVSVPAGQPVQAGDIHRAALTQARANDEIPLLAQSSYDFAFDGDPSNVSDGQRTYKVRISWVADDDGEPVDFDHQAGAVFPTALVGDDKPL